MFNRKENRRKEIETIKTFMKEKRVKEVLAIDIISLLDVSRSKALELMSVVATRYPDEFIFYSGRSGNGSSLVQNDSDDMNKRNNILVKDGVFDRIISTSY